MKIFNIENNKEKVYIQVKDIFYLLENKKRIPSSIYYRFNSLELGHYNETDFIEFDEEQELDFFKSFELLIDYKKIIKLSEAEIIVKRNEIFEQLKELGNMYDNMVDVTQSVNLELLRKCDELGYKLISFDRILSIKRGIKNNNLPIVPNSDSAIIYNKNRTYGVTTSIDPYKLLLFKTDDKIDINNIPKTFLMDCVSNFADNISNEFEIDSNLNYKLSKDSKYLIVDLLEYKKDKNKAKSLIKNIWRILR